MSTLRVDTLQPTTDMTSIDVEDLIGFQAGLDGKLSAANNLSDLTDPAQARVNLGIAAGYLGEVFWHDNRAHLPDGCVAADGQEVDQVGTFADLYADVLAGNRPTATASDWLTTVTKRGCYVATSSLGKMRLPDYNGVQSGSLNAPVMRGDGGSITAGTMQKYGVPNLVGSWGSATTTGGGAGTVNVSDYTSDGIVRHETAVRNNVSGVGVASSTQPSRINIDASRVSDAYTTGLTEVRMNAAVGCYVIRYAGSAQNAGSLDAMTLSTRIESVNSDLQAKIVATNGRMGYALLSTTNPALGSRTVLTNPFGNSVPVVCMPEIYHATLNKWVTTPWVRYATGNISGITAAYAEGEGIIVQCATTLFVGATADSGTTQTVSNYSTPSPVRVHVWKVTA